MKEGLRSGKLKAEKDNVFLKQRVVEKNGNEVKQEGSDSGGEKIPHLVSSGPEESERHFLGDRYAKESGELGSEECGEDGDMGESENVGVAEVAKKRRRVENGEEIDDTGLEEKIVKEEEVDGKVQIGDRVLRSRVVVNGGCDKTESDGVMVGKNRGSDGSHKKCTGVRNEGGDKLVRGFTEKLKGKRGRPPKVDKEESVQLVGGFTEKLKGKRGRPPKVDKEESVQLVGGFTEKLKGKPGRPPKVDKEESVQLVGGFTEKFKGKRGRPPKVDKEESVQLVGGFTENLKGKRGRPPKVDKEESDQLVRGFTEKLTGNQGRPPKVDKEESDQSGGGLKYKKKKLKRKRGRPRNVEKEESDLLDGQLRKKLKFEHKSSLKVKGSNGVLKGNSDKDGNVGFKSKSGFKPQERTKMITNGSNPERINGKGQDVKTFSPAKRDKKGKDLETEDNEDGEGNTKRKQKQKENKERENKQKEQDAELSRRELKESVRDKIVELLLSAGWTIEHRPRNGREYHDAVYVSPAGRTHWSVTLAYKKLKMHCENGNVKSVVCKTGFKFTPLPPEEVSILARVVVKKREGKKNGKKKGKGGNTADGVIEEKGKKRLGKFLKGKHLLLKKDDSESTACKGMLSLVQGRKQQKTKNRKRCALLVRNSENADSENDGYIQYDGKRTVLAWMIDLGTLSLNSKVKYMNRRKTRVLLEGRITRDGIHCGCCKEILSISKFETHAKSDYCEPFKHIYLESQSSLLQCLLDSWNKQEESECRGFHFVDVNSEDPNDDTCGICGDGGDLICCDGCPSTFHQSCLEIKKFPSGDWHCVYCSCKFCGLFSRNTGQRNDNENIAASALLTCHLCEEKYHQSCIQVKYAVNDDSSRPSFCGKNCQELFEKLQMLVGVRHEMEEGFSMTLIRRSDVSSNVSLCDTPQKVDCNSKLIESNSKLAVAFLIMDECFLPMVDHRSGVNLIHNILYNRGSNFNRLNYSGFFTAILERGDEVIAAASIRIHGNYLAEMPFIGTRYMYRRQGMCRRLLTAIESALCSLNVERLVIPAISELRETWTSVFGFKLLEESSRQKMKNMNIVVFPGVDILQKPLLKKLTEANKIPVEGLRSTEHEHHQTVLKVLCDTDERRLAGTDSEATAPHGNETNDELATVESNTQLLCGVSNDNLEGENDTIMVPPGSMCNVHEQTEEINEFQNSDSVPDVRAVDVDTQQNQQSVSEVESKSFMSCHTRPEATHSGIKTLCASREGTENVDCEVRIEDDIVKNLNSHDEGSICRSTENNATELQNVALVDDVKVSGEDIVCHDSETTTQISLDARDLTHHDSQHFQVAGPISCPDGRMFETCEVEYNHSAAQHTPMLMDEVHPESIKDCDSKILNNSKASNDVFHPTSPLAHQKADDFKDHCTNLPVGCSISCSSGRPSYTHEVASAPADSSSHLSCNGISNPLVVADVNLTSNRSQMNTNSLKQSELDSQVDNSSVTQCNSSNTSMVAIHCASGGGNSCGGGTSDAIILSNPAS